MCTTASRKDCHYIRSSRLTAPADYMYSSASVPRNIFCNWILLLKRNTDYFCRCLHWSHEKHLSIWQWLNTKVGMRLDRNKPLPWDLLQIIKVFHQTLRTTVHCTRVSHRLPRALAGSRWLPRALIGSSQLPSILFPWTHYWPTDLTIIGFRLAQLLFNFFDIYLISPQLKAAKKWLNQIKLVYKVLC